MKTGLIPPAVSGIALAADGHAPKDQPARFKQTRTTPESAWRQPAPSRCCWCRCGFTPAAGCALADTNQGITN